MIKAVIFDMFETLITHYESPLYFGPQIAADAGISEARFQEMWQPTGKNRTIGKLTFEEAIRAILLHEHCDSEELLAQIVQKRVAAKEACFQHLHSEIVPLLSKLKEKGLKIGLISNCFSEEVSIIKNSTLFPYFDAVCLSFEEGVQKPDKEIFERCRRRLDVATTECLYVGDGGSFELEAADELGMLPIQAVWYLRKDTEKPSQQKHFIQARTPMEITSYL